MTLDFHHSPADVVRWLIVQLGLGTNPTLDPLQPWPVYDTVEPSTPDSCITVNDTLGMDSGRSFPDGALDSHYGFQVRIRSGDKPSGYLKASNIRRTLAEGVYATRVTPPIPIGSQARYLVHCVSKVGQVLPLGFERGTRRQLFTLNAMVALVVQV